MLLEALYFGGRWAWLGLNSKKRETANLDDSTGRAGSILALLVYFESVQFVLLQQLVDPWSS